MNMTEDSTDNMEEYFEKLFDNRYSDTDSAYQTEVSKPLAPPPCLPNWYTKRRNDWGRRNDNRGRGGYNRGNWGNQRGYHGNYGGGRDRYDNRQGSGYGGHGGRDHYGNRGGGGHYGDRSGRGNYGDRDGRGGYRGYNRDNDYNRNQGGYQGNRYDNRSYR